MNRHRAASGVIVLIPTDRCDGSVARPPVVVVTADTDIG
jgi:hypothetical protein